MATKSIKGLLARAVFLEGALRSARLLNAGAVLIAYAVVRPAYVVNLLSVMSMLAHDRSLAWLLEVPVLSSKERQLMILEITRVTVANHPTLNEEAVAALLGMIMHVPFEARAPIVKYFQTLALTGYVEDDIEMRPSSEEALRRILDVPLDRRMTPLERQRVRETLSIISQDPYFALGKGVYMEDL